MTVSAISIRELQAPIKTRYRDDPSAATIILHVHSAEYDLSDPIHCTTVPAAVPDTVWRSGAHPGVGGVGDAPCSADLLLGALAACQEVTLRMVAAAMGLDLQEVRIEVTGTLDLRGTLGVSREVPVGMQSIRCETKVVVKDDGRPDRAQRLLENAERYCVVLDTLRTGVPVESTFSLETVQA
jgi:uncharacterized OsmC-like protein